MADVLDLVRNVLAVKRLVRLIAHDTIFEDLRVAAFDRWPPEDHKLTYLLSCEKCLSVWAGALVASGLVPRFLLNTLAYSELTILIREGEQRWASST
jgi:hypothetical protein